MLNPLVTCHRCGRVVNTKDDKLKAHNIKGTNITCIGSLEKIRDGR